MSPTFFSNPTHYTIPEFRAYLAGLKLGDWRPSFPTLHNTGVPSLAQWLAYGATPQERWGANLNRYYQGMGWHAGPHLVVCPDYVWILCDLTKPGVSVSCWNSETFGIEMVGNYEVGGDDFAVGEGAKVRDNTAAVLAAVADKFRFGDLADFEIGAHGLHFHHECVRDHHACPGAKVGKPDMLTRIWRMRGALPPVFASVAPDLAPVAPEHKTPPALRSTSDIQAALNKLDVQPEQPVDGYYGSTTAERVRAFQKTHGCVVDGQFGAETREAMLAALQKI